MQDVFFLDFESYSAADLKKVGAYRYAEDPSARILLCAIAKNDGPVELWDSRNEFDSFEARTLIEDMLASPTALVVAHNAPFEIAVCKYVWERTFGAPPPALHRWRCTAAMCRRAAIPWSLEKAAEFLDLPTKKDPLGSKLIQRFCKPNGTAVKGMTEDDAWAAFGRYCVADVEVERLLWKRLQPFALDRDTAVLDGFLFDLRMNDRGIPVNVDALRHAATLVADIRNPMEEEFMKLTGLRPSQREKVLGWLKERGYPAEDLQAATIEEVLDDPPEAMSPEALRALAIRADSAYAAVSKIPSMIDCACSDSRVRGGFLWSGAIRTHRWAGRLVQPQNFKRPTIKDTHVAYEMICAGCDAGALDLLWDSPMEAMASCIRHFIQLPGQSMLDGDFANIEARITPWLCGQDDMLDEFRSGQDVYKTMASFIYSVPEAKVTKDQRFVGKQATLACQFQVSARKFQMMCASFGQMLDTATCELAVERYREKRNLIKQAWWDIQDAAMEAIRNPGRRVKWRRIQFAYGQVAGIRMLQMRLPSGHRLCYPNARIVTATKDFGKGPRQIDQIEFWGKHATKDAWCWVQTYGGKLLENCLAGDTEVLTEEGWMRLDCITTERVFDGKEFVEHGGLTSPKWCATVELDGARMTPEHLVLTTKGWVAARDTNIEDAHEACRRTQRMEDQGHHRPTVRQLGGDARDAAGRLWPREVETQMRLRRGNDSYDQRGHQECEEKSTDVRAQMSFEEDGEEARHVRPSGLLGVAVDAGPLPAAHSPSVEELRRSRHHGVRAVGFVRSVLGGHGSDLQEGSYAGPTGQLERLQPRELRMENSQAAGIEHAQEPVHRNSLGEDDGQAGVREIGDRSDYPSVSLEPMCLHGVDVRPTGRHEQVYDLKNCGPRKRFVIRGKSGREFIVHNCTQAVGGDFMTHALLIAERRGMEAFATIHDQALAVRLPGQTAEMFRQALTVLPHWADGFPLAADCGEVGYYTKD